MNDCGGLNVVSLFLKPVILELGVGTLLQANFSEPTRIGH